MAGPPATRPDHPPNRAGPPPQSGRTAPQIGPDHPPNRAGPPHKSGRPPVRTTSKSGRTTAPKWSGHPGQGGWAKGSGPFFNRVRTVFNRGRTAGRTAGRPRGRRAGPARTGAGPYVAGGGPGGRPWRPAGRPRGGRGRPARDSKRAEWWLRLLRGGCVRAPTLCNRPRPACALPRVLTRRQSPTRPARPDQMAGPRPAGRTCGPDRGPAEVASPVAGHAENRAGPTPESGRTAVRTTPRIGPAGWPDGRPDTGPHHSVECARSPKSGSPGSFLPIFFAGGVKDALFRRPSGPNPPPPPRRGARPVRSTSYGTPVLTPSQHLGLSRDCSRL